MLKSQDLGSLGKYDIEGLIVTYGACLFDPTRSHQAYQLEQDTDFVVKNFMDDIADLINAEEVKEYMDIESFTSLNKELRAHVRKLRTCYDNHDFKYMAMYLDYIWEELKNLAEEIEEYIAQYVEEMEEEEQ